MMPTPFGNEMRALASSLLSAEGLGIQVVFKVPLFNHYDAVTGSAIANPVDTPVQASPVLDEEIESSGVEGVNVRKGFIFVPGSVSFTPVRGMNVSIGEKDWRVASVEVLSGDELPAVYKVNLESV